LKIKHIGITSLLVATKMKAKTMEFKVNDLYLIYEILETEKRNLLLQFFSKEANERAERIADMQDKINDHLADRI
tara:strand:+ start:783 stop:1007 length:225 start_codon:yes stop_codon:yes gene_type:complete